MVAEKHASTLDFPKGRRVTARTVEIFRQWGLEAAVSALSLPEAGSLFVFEGETLHGAGFRRRGMRVDDVSRPSPAGELICSQELLEPVLRERATDDGADVRFAADPARLAGGVGRGRRHMTQAGDDARLWKIEERAGRRALWRCSGAVGEAPLVLAGPVLIPA
jgi:hypothetical protein